MYFIISNCTTDSESFHLPGLRQFRNVTTLSTYINVYFSAFNVEVLSKGKVLQALKKREKRLNISAHTF